MLSLLRAALVLLFLSGSVHAACVGDCGGDGEVTVNDLVLAVVIALGDASVDTCPAADADGDGAVTVSELVEAVSGLLGSCDDTATPTLRTVAARNPPPSATASQCSTRGRSSFRKFNSARRGSAGGGGADDSITNNRDHFECRRLNTSVRARDNASMADSGHSGLTELSKSRV